MTRELDRDTDGRWISRKATTHARLQVERYARQIGLTFTGWRDGKPVIRIKVEGIRT